MTEKRKFRKQLLQKRNEMDIEIRKRATEIIADKVIESEWFVQASDVFAFMNFGSEVGTLRIIQESWKMGKTLWLPKVEGSVMEFYQITEQDELQKGAFGILEPKGDTRKAEGISGFMIVPGVAFSLEGNRIGYGRGYYDRYLEQYPDMLTIGIGFDIQLVDEIPAEEHDKKLNMIMTELRTIS